MKTKSLLLLVLLLSSSLILKSQVFQGFDAFDVMIEYEGQRYLMAEIYKVTEENYDKLKIEKTIIEKDVSQGFMFVLTSYIYNNNKGVVITSFNSVDFDNTRHFFTNIHLTDQEYTELYHTYLDLERIERKGYEHLLRSYNERLIVDVHTTNGYEYFTLWVDIKRRHTFTKSKWDRAYKRFQKFINE